MQFEHRDFDQLSGVAFDDSAQVYHLSPLDYIQGRYDSMTQKTLAAAAADITPASVEDTQIKAKYRELLRDDPRQAMVNAPSSSGAANPSGGRVYGSKLPQPKGVPKFQFRPSRAPKRR